MRKRRYRVFDRIQKKMRVLADAHDSFVFPQGQGSYYNYQNGDGSSPSGDFRDEEYGYVLMEDTFVKDSNNSSIFEGDFLESKNPEIKNRWKVFFEDGSYVFEAVGKNFGEATTQKQVLCKEAVKAYSLAVCGNIFQGVLGGHTILLLRPPLK